MVSLPEMMHTVFITTIVTREGALEPQLEGVRVVGTFNVTDNRKTVSFEFF